MGGWTSKFEVIIFVYDAYSNKDEIDQSNNQEMISCYRDLLYAYSQPLYLCFWY